MNNHAPRGVPRVTPTWMRAIASIFVALVALTLVFGDPISSAAATTAPKPAATQLYWGAAIDGPAYGAGIGNVPGDMQGVSIFESHAGKSVSMIELGAWWEGNGQWFPLPTSDFDNIRNHGAVPLFTWQSTGDNPADFQNAIIASGRYDPYIHMVARAAQQWGHPFFMRFDHEMDGWWYAWGEGATTPGGPLVNGNHAGDYVRMYRHVHDIFTQEHATNVTWVWSVNHEAADSRYPPLSQIYPGKAYVDWSGIDPYNFYPGWLTLNQVMTGVGTTWISNTYQKILAVAPNKPMMIAEFGSIEAATAGSTAALKASARPSASAMIQARALAARGPSILAPTAQVQSGAASATTVQPPSSAATKPAWLRDALLTQLVYNFPAVKAILYYNRATEYATMPIESSTDSTTAFAQGIASPLYATARLAALPASPILPLTEAVAYLTPGADTYIASEAPSSTSGASALFLSVNGDPSATHKAYLRFNLASLQGKTIDQVVLQLTSTAATGAPSGDTINVSYLANNSWAESLNWKQAAKLSAGTPPVGSLANPSTASTNYTISLPASLVQSNLSTGKLSLQLDDASSDEFQFASREVGDTTQRPQLIVAYR